MSQRRLLIIASVLTLVLLGASLIIRDQFLVADSHPASPTVTTTTAGASGAEDDATHNGIESEPGDTRQADHHSESDDHGEHETEEGDD